MNEPGPSVESLLDAWIRLAERERKVLCTLAWRLAAGQRKFGPLTVAKKDWTFEALEEVLDACVYMGAALSDKADIAFERAVSDAEAEVGCCAV